MVRTSFRGALATIIVAGLGVAPALATPIHFSQLNTAVVNLNGGTSDSDGAPQATTDTLGPITSAGTNASATAFVNDGVLGAITTATAGSQDSGSNTAQATAVFFDTLTLFSSSLAEGTVVDLLFTMALTGTASSTNLSTDGCRASIQGVLNVDPEGLQNEAELQGFIQAAPCADKNSAPSVIVQAAIGDEVIVAATLNAVASARFGATATANATNTLRFFADPQGAFSYTTSSGNTYFTPSTAPAAVPEPASLLLFGTGLAAAGARRYRSRRRVSVSGPIR